MPHAHHFLSRLDRVSLPHVELALGLYRDEPLLRYILDRARPPEGAARVAISLDHPERGPFLVVTRDGHFVTCLGEGMSPGDLPVITRGQLDAIAAHAEDLRARLAAATAMAGEGGVFSLLRRIYDAGGDLSREEFVAISALQPLYAAEFFGLAFEAIKELRGARKILIPHLRKADRLRPEFKEALRAYWNTHWAMGHLLVLSAMNGVRPDALPPRVLDMLDDFTPSVGATRQGILSLALKGAWAAARIGKPLLGLYKRAYHEANVHFLIIDAALGLVALGARHARLRAEVQKALAAPPPAGASPPAAYDRLLQKIRAAASQFFDDECATPEVIAETHRRFGASVWIDITRHLPPGAPFRYPRPEDVPEDLAMTAAVNASFYFLDFEPNALLWLFTVAPWVARAEPEQLYLPREALRAIHEPWKPEHTLILLRNFRDAERRPAPRRPEGPARKGPCPCGSGKKYKRCCGESADEA